MTGGGPARVFVALEERPRDGLRAVHQHHRLAAIGQHAGDVGLLHLPQ